MSVHRHLCCDEHNGTEAVSPALIAPGLCNADERILTGSPEISTERETISSGFLQERCTSNIKPYEGLSIRVPSCSKGSETLHACATASNQSAMDTSVLLGGILRQRFPLSPLHSHGQHEEER